MALLTSHPDIPRGSFRKKFVSTSSNPCLSFPERLLAARLSSPLIRGRGNCCRSDSFASPILGNSCCVARGRRRISPYLDSARRSGGQLLMSASEPAKTEHTRFRRRRTNAERTARILRSEMSVKSSEVSLFRRSLRVFAFPVEALYFQFRSRDPRELGDVDERFRVSSYLPCHRNDQVTSNLCEHR